tara:strand:- start:169 stop:285 length:117 start_codon:yes stop_codon:yes gene_type:complete
MLTRAVFYLTVNENKKTDAFSTVFRNSKKLLNFAIEVI